MMSIEELRQMQKVLQKEIEEREKQEKQKPPVHSMCKCGVSFDPMDEIEKLISAEGLKIVSSFKGCGEGMIAVAVPEDLDISEVAEELAGKLADGLNNVYEKPKKEEHITPVTEIISDTMKTVRFMGNSVRVPKEIPLPEALFYLLEHYKPVKK